MQLSLHESLAKLEACPQTYLELFRHGKVSVEIYKPVMVDLQQPHDQDELYVIMAGKGDFYLEGETRPFQAGDVLFVPAQAVHRFLNFSDDFTTWVIFFG
ncbi:MAG: cupin domain-containing protein [Bacteroidetes bacterium]|nr:MAG: cupin domain-containing protein [Bacteroidota bacterium]